MIRSMTKGALVATGIGAATTAAIIGAAVGLVKNRSDGVDSESSDGDHDFGESKTILIGLPASELYTFCREPKNFAAFMTHVERVVENDDGTASWHLDETIGFDGPIVTRMIDDEPNESLSWKSESGSGAKVNGTVTFRPATGDRGTYVELTNDYLPAGTSIGALLGKATGFDAKIQARHDLKRLKMLMETGEIATSANTTADTNQNKD